MTGDTFFPIVIGICSAIALFLIIFLFCIVKDWVISWSERRLIRKMIKKHGIKPGDIVYIKTSLSTSKNMYGVVSSINSYGLWPYKVLVEKGLVLHYGISEIEKVELE